MEDGAGGGCGRRGEIEAGEAGGELCSRCDGVSTRFSRCCVISFRWYVKLIEPREFC